MAMVFRTNCLVGFIWGFFEKSATAFATASSYFKYIRFSHLHKFFDSDEHNELEKRFSKMCHLQSTQFVNNFLLYYPADQS
jgi:hypothetical protein